MLRPYPLNIHPIAPEPVLGQFTPDGVDEEEHADQDEQIKGKLIFDYSLEYVGEIYPPCIFF